jgi:hypothetical protein
MAIDQVQMWVAGAALGHGRGCVARVHCPAAIHATHTVRHATWENVCVFAGGIHAFARI